MTSIKKIAQNYAAADQLHALDFQGLMAQGYQSVINLRSPLEKGFLVNEDALVAEAGLEYRHLPLSPTKADPQAIEAVLGAIQTLPKPILIHCAAGARAGVVALIALAIEENLGHNEVFQKAQELGISLQQPQLQQFLNHYLAATPA
ncbi:sulfur transferase domain-containing protein [Thermosynechococcaceae cyanobacterium BACA0444]|uniref:Sulfur transferase domain-containing protein n=1 Tax=Pseudocalidococcus azoricus BACA0444 TaxID=2918990 RepID=A0AAE4FTY6_9CYAN|nr:sulfur transferase domain-containing protein [Pseudocalidococcus azoricus]MDS3862141.1 sulfur transferase domain-containing protein [Pseudocalidococcus azoricus BACA0444]